MNIIYKDNDNTIKLMSLVNGDTGAYINDATVAVTLKDVNGSNVVGETWPLTMSYVTGSNGQYKATLKDTLTLTANDRYTAYITAVSGTANLEIELPCTARDRIG